MGSTISIGMGQQKTLSVTDAPSGWLIASANAGVATVGTTKIVRGISQGTTYFNIYTSSMSYVGQITVNVTASGGTTTSTPMVKGGSDYTIALKSDGTVWAWGSNISGQLGDGTTTQRNTPVQVSGLTGITAIAVGGRHTIALKSDGTVWAWGDNYYGQLGDGTTITTSLFGRTTPIQVSGLTSINIIAGGSGHTIALKNDGTVYACGHNQYGQLGDGTATDRYTPLQVLGSGGTGYLTLK